MASREPLDIGELRMPTPDEQLGEPLVLLEILNTLASPEEVEFLIARAFGDVGVAPDSVPRARESLTFLAGAAVRCRNMGIPLEATWCLISDSKGLDKISSPDAKAFWGRIRLGMRALSRPDWKPLSSQA